MRAQEVNAGSIRALLLILALIFANATVAHFYHPDRGAAESKDLAKITSKVVPPNPSASLEMPSSSMQHAP